MLPFRLTVLLLVATLVPTIGFAQTYRSYGEWSTICDNLRRCSAFGYSPENESNAYVHVSRGGQADAEPTIELAVQSDGAARDRKLIATVRGGAAQRTFSVGPLVAVGDGAFAHAIIPAPMSIIFVGSLRDARSIEIRLLDRAAPDERGTVSLAGSSAALRSMDARQLRVGTTTALVARGTAPESSVPPPPFAPVMAPHRMHDLPTPAVPGSNLAPGADPICASAGERWIAIAPGRALRGVCVAGGAYNTVYRFYVIEAGRAPRPVSFPVPWRAVSADNREIVNPELSKDGLLLSSFSKGVGLGTCGEAADWIWTGSVFRLFHLTEMRECRGILSEGWPVLFQARMAR